MTDSKIDEIQDVLTDVDTLLRKRLKALGVDIHHVLLAITPDGGGVIRSNAGPDALSDLADVLADIADEAVTSRSSEEPLN